MTMRNIIVAISLSIVGITGMTSVSEAQSRDNRLITVYDHGISSTFVTNAGTLGDALKDANMTLDPHDSVEPALDSKLIAPEYQVNIYRARPVIVVDGNVRLRTLSARQTPEQITKDAGITLQDRDTAKITQGNNILNDGPSIVLNITRATPFVLDLYGRKINLRSQQKTVGDMLREQHITLGTDDHLSVDMSTPLAPNMNIRIWREGIQTLSIDEEITPSRRIVYDVNQPLGYRAVQTKGIAGVRNVTYQIEIKEGNEVSRKQLASVVSREPSEQVDVIGLRNDGRGLTKSKGAQYFTDSKGVSHRETYYDLPMAIVMGACGQGGRYSVRPDGAKVDSDGYIIIAANYGNYPRCSIVETSLGPGKVYDTGGFAANHPTGFDLATDWTNGDGI